MNKSASATIHVDSPLLRPEADLEGSFLKAPRVSWDVFRIYMTSTRFHETFYKSQWSESVEEICNANPPQVGYSAPSRPTP